MFNNLLRKFYADNTVLNLGAGGDTIATDDIGGVKHELVKIEYGADGSATQVSPVNPLPVTDAAVLAAIAVLVAGQQSDALTDAELRATPVSVTIGANPGVDIGDVTINNAAGVAAVNIQDGGNSITVDGTFFQATQPISAATLPLPSGAATAALQTQPGVDIGDVTINNAAGAGAVNIQDGGNSITVDGTVAVTGAGDATAANQATEIASLASIDAGIPAALGQTTMANSMPVTLASDQSSLVVSVGAIDNTTLYSNTLAVTGAITGILTTGYQSIIFSFSGVWVGLLLIEGSEDNSIWEQKIVLDVNEFAMQDIINENGIFQIKSSSKYIRINVQQVSGTITALIVGRTVPGLNAADSIAFAMDKSFNMPLYIEETATRKDTRNALIPSDAPAPIYGFAQATSAVLFNVDTTGYQSVVVQAITLGSNITVQSSNDGINWTNLLGFNAATITGTATINATGIWDFPVIGKFIRGQMTGPSFSNCLIYLRQKPVNPFNLSGGGGVNIQSLAGSTLAVAATLGPTGSVGSIASLPVGAINAPGSTTVPYPIIIGGREAASDGALSGKVRTLLTDTLGRAIVTGAIPAAAGIQNQASVPTLELSQFEGQSQIEILAQVLLELRILNQNISELPIALQSQNGTLDEPLKYRNDPSVFAN